MHQINPTPKTDHKTREAQRHAGFRAIQAILGDEQTLTASLDSVGGLGELQEVVRELSLKSDEWDVMLALKEWRLAWLEGSF